MKETFKERLKKAGGCVWWLFGMLCFICVLIILVGLSMCFMGEKSGGIVMLVSGTICLLFFVGICIVLPYIQWKKGIEAKPVTLPSNHKIGSVSKKSILSDLYTSKANIKKCALPVSVAVMIAFFLIYISFNDLTNSTRLAILIVAECVFFLLGIRFYISSTRAIKNFDKVELEFYKRPVIKKTTSVGVDGEQDNYCFKFEGFSDAYLMVTGVDFSDKIKVGDECILVCYKGKKTIINMFCMKHWDVADDILGELQ